MQIITLYCTLYCQNGACIFGKLLIIAEESHAKEPVLAGIRLRIFDYVSSLPFLFNVNMVRKMHLSNWK